MLSTTCTRNQAREVINVATISQKRHGQISCCSTSVLERERERERDDDDDDALLVAPPSHKIPPNIGIKFEGRLPITTISGVVGV